MDDGRVYTTGAWAAPESAWAAPESAWAAPESAWKTACPLGDVQNSLLGNNHGIQKIFVRLLDTEFHKILDNFVRNTEVMEVKKKHREFCVDGIPCTT
jgi:hypothetical protein